jgi:hypothetical protein
VGLAVGLGDGVTVGVALGVGLGVGVTVGVALGVGLGLGVAVGVGLGVGVGGGAGFTYNFAIWLVTVPPALLTSTRKIFLSSKRVAGGVV